MSTTAAIFYAVLGSQVGYVIGILMGRLTKP